ncbi:pentatricopeptide repeat-containing protein DOT4, chloroplastic-like [Rutidosis leptorrhynchoides]|uniref:pentatricopeptide repeat-containing protein DOT4, chloroplastic-like n=1 Tax=Rutidosis leptorrhynchoides TaxID=125765 RepID=UPI003A999382
MGNLQKAMNLIFTSEKCNLEAKTYCDVLQLCADLKVYNIICLKGTEIDHVLGSKLVFMFISCGDLNEGRRIFNNISDNIPKINVFRWNFMMNAYAKNDDYKESVYLFTKMIEIGFEPDGYTFTCIFKCLAGFEDDNNLSEMIHGYVLKSGFGFDSNVV